MISSQYPCLNDIFKSPYLKEGHILRFLVDMNLEGYHSNQHHDCPPKGSSEGAGWCFGIPLSSGDIWRNRRREKRKLMLRDWVLWASGDTANMVWDRENTTQSTRLSRLLSGQWQFSKYFSLNQLGGWGPQMALRGCRWAFTCRLSATPHVFVWPAES